MSSVSLKCCLHTTVKFVYIYVAICWKKKCRVFAEMHSLSVGFECQHVSLHATVIVNTCIGVLMLAILGIVNVGNLTCRTCQVIAVWHKLHVHVHVRSMSSYMSCVANTIPTLLMWLDVLTYLHVCTYMCVSHAHLARACSMQWQCMVFWVCWPLILHNLLACWHM